MRARSHTARRIRAPGVRPSTGSDGLILTRGRVRVTASLRSCVSCGRRLMEAAPEGRPCPPPRPAPTRTLPGMLRTVTATRYVTPFREGGSLPGLCEADDDGLYVVKFRGAGQGPN